MCGLCQRGVARGAYTRSDSQGAFRCQQACLAFLDQLRPCGRSTYLLTTTTETLADSTSGYDITNDHRFQPGQAPAGWTNLVDHLRQHGVSDDEMIITGVATHGQH